MADPGAFSPLVAPSVFTDIMASQLLLQPDAEYVWARMLYSAALGNAAMEGSLLDVSQFSAADRRPLPINGDAANMLAALGYGEGGPLMLSLGASYPQLVSFREEARNPGENVLIDRPQFINGDTTFANRVAGSATKLFAGVNTQSPGMEQVSIKIVETLGPADPAGNISPISIPTFALSRARYDMAVNVGVQLKRDRYRLLNAKMQGDVIGAATAAGFITYQDDSITALNQYTSAGAEPFNVRMIRRMSEQLTNRKIPGVFGTRRYPLFLDNHQYTQIKDDSAYQRMAVFQPEYNFLFPGYIASVDDALICVDITMAQLVNQLGAGNNITGYQCVMMGSQAYGWALAKAAELRRNRDDDGGRNNQFGWNAYEGFGVLDARFFQVGITD